MLCRAPSLPCFLYELFLNGMNHRYSSQPKSPPPQELKHTHTHTHTHTHICTHSYGLNVENRAAFGWYVVNRNQVSTLCSWATWVWLTTDMRGGSSGAESKTLGQRGWGSDDGRKKCKKWMGGGGEGATWVWKRSRRPKREDESMRGGWEKNKGWGTEGAGVRGIEKTWGAEDVHVPERGVHELDVENGLWVAPLLVCGHLSLLLCHTHSPTVSTVRSRPTVAKVAMATSHQNGNYN